MATSKIAGLESPASPEGCQGARGHLSAVSDRCHALPAEDHLPTTSEAPHPLNAMPSMCSAASPHEPAAGRAYLTSPVHRATTGGRQCGVEWERSRSNRRYGAGARPGMETSGESAAPTTPILFEDTMPLSIAEPVSWLLLFISVALAAALAVAGNKLVRQRRAARDDAAHIKNLRAAIEMRDAELTHLVATQLPALVQGLWQGQETEVPGPLYPQLQGTAFPKAQETILGLFRDVTLRASERAEDAARAAVSAVTRSMSPLLNDMTRAVDVLVEQHADPAVLAHANDIDHAKSQLARRVQVIGVLTQAWPGRQRRNSPLLSVVRGGVSRIRDYGRIKITGEPSYKLISRVVEPVVLAIAELLDNAARHSAPTSDVQVWFVEAHNGVTVMIDDAGVGLKPEDGEAAARLLSGREPVRLTRMGTRPRFGFPAIGALAQRYGFVVSVEQSSIYGGVRAGLFLPSALLAAPEEEYVPGARSSQSQRTPEPPAVTTPDAAVPDATAAKAPAPDPAPVRAQADGELPQRVRSKPVRQTRPVADVNPPRNSGRALGAFTRGISSAQADRNSDERTFKE